MAILLNDPVAVSAYPNIVLVIDGAAVNEVWNGTRVPHRANDIAGGIEHDDRRRLQRSFFLLVGDVTPVDDDHMVMGIDANTAELPRDPTFRQGLGPIGIGLEFGRFVLRLR